MPVIPEGKNIFVIDLEYIEPLEKVEPLLEAHMAFINKYYENETFIASGPKVPRTGGVVLAVSDSREEIETLLAEDPFHAAKVVRYTVTEFYPRRTADGL